MSVPALLAPPRRRARLGLEPWSVAVISSDWGFLRALLAQPGPWKGVVHLARGPQRAKPAWSRALRACLGRDEEDVVRTLHARRIPLARVTAADLARRLPTWLELLGVDLAISYRNPIFPEALVGAPRLGVINLHPSLLPAYRGADPLLAMARDFCLAGGVSAHWMSAALDCGDVLGQVACPIPEAVDAAAVQRDLIVEHGIPLVQACLRHLAAGERLGGSQPDESPTAPARFRTDRAAWGQIDWERWSLRHLRHYLAQRPFWESRLPERTGWRARVAWRVGQAVEATPSAPPGAILRTPRGYQVAHRDGYVELRARASARRLLRGAAAR